MDGEEKSEESAAESTAHMQGKRLHLQLAHHMKARKATVRLTMRSFHRGCVKTALTCDWLVFHTTQ